MNKISIVGGFDSLKVGFNDIKGDIRAVVSPIFTWIASSFSVVKDFVASSFLMVKDFVILGFNKIDWDVLTNYFT